MQCQPNAVESDSTPNPVVISETTPLTASHADDSYTPVGSERVGLTGYYTSINNNWVQEMPDAPLEFRCLMVLARNTVGRQQTWDTTANRYFSERVGWHGLSPTKSVDTKRIIKVLRRLEEWGMVESRCEKDGMMKDWRIREDFRLWFTVEKRRAKNEREAFKEFTVNMEEISVVENQRASDLGRKLTWTEVEEMIDAFPVRPIFKTNFMQWPNAFEDVMGPNIPRRLYRFLMRVWTETHGRINHKRDGFDKMRPWKAPLLDVGSEMMLNDRKTIEKYIAFAEKWGFVVVNRKKGMTNTYLPGPHLWQLAKTGDLSEAYRMAFSATTRAGYSALSPKATATRSGRRPRSRTIRHRQPKNVGF